MVAITRVTGWQTALRTWARGVVGQPYVWGKTDCGSLARNALLVMFNAEVLRNVIWPSPLAAMRVVEKNGAMSTILLALGATKHPVTFAQSGDIIIEPATDAPGGESACVVIDGTMAVYSTHDGGVMWGPLPKTGDAYSLRQVTDG